MRTTFVTLLACVVWHHPPIQEGPGELIERLRSERIEEREAAAKKLSDLGKAAVGPLERASQDPDAEVAARAKRLLRLILCRDRLTPAFKKAIPDAEERLSSEDPRVWTILFLEAVERTEGTREPLPGLRSGDLVTLVGPAICGALSRDEKWKVSGAIERLRLRTDLSELARFVGDRNGAVRAKAVQALLALQSRDAVPGALRLLDDEDVGVRIDALWYLKGVGAPEAAPRVLSLLQDEDSRIRTSAAATAGGLGLGEAIPTLRTFLKAESAALVIAATNALAELRDKGAVGEILRLLSHNEDDVKQTALGALSELDATDHAPKLVPLLQDASAPVRGAAADALGRLGHAEAVQHLATLLADEDTAVRAKAIRALGRLKAKEVGTRLVPLIGDKDLIVRMNAATTLGALGTQEAVAPLSRWLDHEDHPVKRGKVLAALTRLDPALGTERALRDMESEVHIVRLEVMGVLIDVGAPSTVPGLIKLLEHHSEGVRGTAISALGRLKPPTAIPHLLKMLEDQSPSVRGEAALALGDMGVREAVSPLRGLVKRNPADADGEPSIDIRCAWVSLCSLGERSAVPAFLRQEEENADPNYIVLNGVKAPAAWQLCLETRLNQDLTGSRREVLGELAKKAGLKLDASFASPGWLRGRMSITHDRGHASVAEAMYSLWRSPYDCVIEDDELRLVHKDKARQFWTEWWAAESKK